jgi:hypothetical protein
MVGVDVPDQRGKLREWRGVFVLRVFEDRTDQVNRQLGLGGQKRTQ